MQHATRRRGTSTFLAAAASAVLAPVLAAASPTAVSAQRISAADHLGDSVRVAVNTATAITTTIGPISGRLARVTRDSLLVRRTAEADSVWIAAGVIDRVEVWQEHPGAGRRVGGDVLKGVIVGGVAGALAGLVADRVFSRGEAGACPGAVGVSCGDPPGSLVGVFALTGAVTGGAVGLVVGMGRSGPTWQVVWTPGG